MQKIITVTIDPTKLQPATGTDADAACFVNELPELNQYLSEGWVIEEWERLTPAGNDRITLLFVLTDEIDEMADQYEFEEDQLEEE
ncbi:hypothetical protein [Chitinophaga vietnamensis]|uniref:hypothetical protein n=1 Tax=Chitinophaga vietnamensis TaxID=2593957 RepID=UPI00117742BA|nr:hypothetical protein [Chitinophaga vietnamensis]